MKKLALPIVIVVGTLAGGGGGYFLKSSGLIMNDAGAQPHATSDDGAAADAHHEPAGDHKKDNKADGHGGKSGIGEVFRFREQFIIPVLEDGLPTAIIVLDFEIEMDQKTLDKAALYESRLRDLFVERLLRQGATGSLREIVHDSPARLVLKDELRAEAVSVLGDGVSSVFIRNIGIQRY